MGEVERKLCLLWFGFDEDGFRVLVNSLVIAEIEENYMEIDRGFWVSEAFPVAFPSLLF